MIAKLVFPAAAWGKTTTTRRESPRNYSGAFEYLFRALILLLALCAAGCKRGDDKKLFIYNWTYYCPDSVIEKFEQEYGIEVVYDEYASNEDMYAKIHAGGTGYDLVFPSAEYITIMIEQGMLAKIDKSKLSNMGNIDPFIMAKAVYDPNMNYHVPYCYGAAGVIINTAKVPVYKESWSIFSRSDLRGRMTMLDDLREVLGAGLTVSGYSANSTNPDEIFQARDFINTSWRPNLVKFDAEAFSKGYATGDFWVVHGYYESVVEELHGNQELLDNTLFIIPKEGGTAYLDGICILKGAKHVDAALKFIDFIHRPEIYAEFTDYFGFPSVVNIPARALKKAPSYITEEELYRTELKLDVGSAIDYYNEAWFDSIRIGK
ncbi:MAG: extracellular solute-binding protein [Spirochaetaceae bacterium]|jgi:spermidine/putrescine transport system substrate-binding protein|nr:extracellular solute-binding protein [Spirochaetaceae bacterium]